MQQISFITKTFKLFAKVVQSFVRAFVTAQCATLRSREKSILKFKLLYLLNHISYFNQICRLCCANTVLWKFDLNPYYRC